MANIVPLSDLTQASLEGAGVFDVLMRSMKAHLEAEYQKGRIKGPEYSTVYLGAMDSVLQTSLNFLLQRQRVALEAELMAQQVLVAQAEVQKALAQVDVARAEVEKTRLEVEILGLTKEKIPAEIAVLLAQKCKLDAEFDLVQGQTVKTASETTLLTQKTVTEKAQVSATGVDDNSVIGKQKSLYQAQTEGFSRDAEQKAAKLMMDVWNVQRTTDEGIAPSEEAKNTDVYIGRAVGKMLQGIGA